MKNAVVLFTLFLFHCQAWPDESVDRLAITQAVKNYLIAQHDADERPMDAALHGKMAKRTHWQDKSGNEFIMETSRDTMLAVARNYNKDGTKFPESPRIQVEIFDIDQRVASVKLTADDWIDYMHLVKSEQGEWKIINVLWQYHDINKHQSK